MTSLNRILLAGIVGAVSCLHAVAMQDRDCLTQQDMELLSRIVGMQDLPAQTNKKIAKTENPEVQQILPEDPATQQVLNVIMENKQRLKENENSKVLRQIVNQMSIKKIKHGVWTAKDQTSLEAVIDQIKKAGVVLSYPALNSLATAFGVSNSVIKLKIDPIVRPEVYAQMKNEAQDLVNVWGNTLPSIYVISNIASKGRVPPAVVLDIVLQIRAIRDKVTLAEVDQLRQQGHTKEEIAYILRTTLSAVKYPAD